MTISTDEASPARSQAPAFNVQEALERVDNDQELLAEIAGLFVADAPAMLEAVATAVAAGDAPAVARAAHRLKGSILTFGAADTAALAQSLELTGSDPDFPAAHAILARLTPAVARLRTALEAFVVNQRKTA